MRRTGIGTRFANRSAPLCARCNCRSCGGSSRRDGLDPANEKTSGSTGRRAPSEHRASGFCTALGSSKATAFLTPSSRRLWRRQSRVRTGNSKHGYWRIDIFISPLWPEQPRGTTERRGGYGRGYGARGTTSPTEGLDEQRNDDAPYGRVETGSSVLPTETIDVLAGG